VNGKSRVLTSLTATCPPGTLNAWCHNIDPPEVRCIFSLELRRLAGKNTSLTMQQGSIQSRDADPVFSKGVNNAVDTTPNPTESPSAKRGSYNGWCQGIPLTNARLSRSSSSSSRD
jgi:hypothetical protein